MKINVFCHICPKVIVFAGIVGETLTGKHFRKCFRIDENFCRVDEISRHVAAVATTYSNFNGKKGNMSNRRQMLSSHVESTKSPVMLSNQRV